MQAMCRRTKTSLFSFVGAGDSKQEMYVPDEHNRGIERRMERWVVEALYGFHDARNDNRTLTSLSLSAL